MRSLWCSFLKVVGCYAVLVAVLTAVHFPAGVDDPMAPALLTGKAEAFYEEAYTEPAGGGESLYVRAGQLAAHEVNIAPALTRFVEEFHLQQARTLDVGAGTGSLQDIVDNYVGLDIAASAARYFRKPFVQGSATNLPFKDSEFDLCWTIWTLEHVPNPEQALREIRRVVKGGGYLYLCPAWNNPTWAPKAYLYRPDSELTAPEIMVKYSLYVRELSPFIAAYRFPTRIIRLASTRLSGKPSQLRYHKIDVNFETFRMPDSDAVNSIDCYEMQLWFRSRGDDIVEFGDFEPGVFGECSPLIVRLNKSNSASPERASSSARR